MEYVDKAIEHTPTMMELYMIKAKVYKVYILVISIFNVFSGNWKYYFITLLYWYRMLVI